MGDESTLVLMAEFYRQMRAAPTKMAALQRAQVALLRQQVAFQDGRRESISLPIPVSGERDFSHPYDWAAFTLVGNPW
ncbi:MAG: CHAT domain-containing protein [Gloeomargarita sp. SKYG116]|nr:CHAT domain-containing protein [Gloeomargarita sp. SKYG116]MCS7225746.1 CHAT domain-containing protein [Gloeomargarita sp. SKYB31]MDW8400308.1 CHAT domain-containing protein [Gloeomargarita sp. SKYGB_i_bin116]